MTTSSSPLSDLLSPKTWVETLLGFYVPRAALMASDDIRIGDTAERDIERAFLSGLRPKLPRPVLRSWLAAQRRQAGRKAPTVEVRRTAPGTIDMDYYRSRALALREAAREDRTAMKFLAAGISVSAITLAVFLTIAASHPVTVVEHIPAPARASSTR